MDEIEKQFLTEFDYTLEAINMQVTMLRFSLLSFYALLELTISALSQDIHDNIMPKWGDKVYVPAPVMELCRPQVLVMDYVPGMVHF